MCKNNRNSRSSNSRNANLSLSSDDDQGILNIPQQYLLLKNKNNESLLKQENSFTQ